MVRAAKDALSDRTIWFLVGLVFLCVFLVLAVVFRHEEAKPKSPQALAAAALNQIFNVQEWKPGMGTQPFMYHPAGFDTLVWKPLPGRTANPLPQNQAQGPPLNWMPMNQAGRPLQGAGRQ
jgi:hypothetical protein